MGSDKDSYSIGRVAGIILVVMMVASVPLGGLVLADTSGGAMAQETTQQETTQASEDPAMVRIVHASPDFGNVNVTVDNQSVASDVMFGTATDYMELSPGQHTVNVTAEQNQNMTAETTVTVESGQSYSLVATGEISEGQDVSFEVVQMEDRRSGPTDGALVRVANFSPDAGAVDVTVAGSDQVIADGAQYNQSGDYVNVPAGNYTLQVRSETSGNDGEILHEMDVSFDSNSVYTAWVLGYSDFTDEPVVVGLTLTVTNDTMSGAAPAPVQTTQAATQMTTQAATEMTTEAETETTEEETTSA